MKKALKILSLVLALVMCVTMFAACNKDAGGNETSTNEAGSNDAVQTATLTPVAKADLKVGFIFLHDENSTYDKNFMDAAKAAQATLGLTDEQVLFKTGIPEGSECQEAAAELVDAGCNVVFADSFGHEDYMIAAAKEFPDVQFCHATGTKAHTEKLANYHNAFAAIYDGRYLAGIAAGMKINELITAGTCTADTAKMGYVGAFPYAEVKSGYTSFYLGAKSVCPTVTMEVKYTNSWYDEALEKEAANALIQDGCVLISQHADSMGAPTACETAGIPNVSYNGSTTASCPKTAIISSKINWEPYFEYMINSVINGTVIDTDWTGTIATGSVELTDLNTAAAADGTQEAIDTAKAAIEAGTLHVFDTTTFTVKGAALTTYTADVDDAGDYIPETEAIKDGYFNESDASLRSAPYFDILIDGITEA